jgi:superoxide oxidase
MSERSLHRLLCVLVVIVGLLGLLHDSWPRHSHAFWMNLHALAGLLLWILALGRLCTRLTPAARLLPPLARCARLLLYALLVVTPFFGMLTLAWQGTGLNLGIYQIDFGFGTDRAIYESTEDIHAYLAYAVFGLALFQIIGRDGI